MTNRISLEEEEIIRKLKELDRSDIDYPADSFEKRRASFRKATNGLILGVPLVGFLKGRFNLLGHLQAKTMETILIGTLVVGAGLSAYQFRDQIKDWLTPGQATQVVTLSASLTQPSLTSSPTASLTPTATVTQMPTKPVKTPPTDQGLHLGQTKTPKP